MARSRRVVHGAVMAIAAVFVGGCRKSEPEKAAPPSAPPASAPAADPAKTDAPPAAPAGGKGTLAGVVTWGGPAPDKKTVPVTKDHEACGREVPYQEIVVGPGGGLANALVSIDGLKPATPYKADAPILFDQKECLFTQRVTVVPVGATLEVKNSDSILHNTHFNSTRNKAENLAIPAGGSQSVTLSSAENIKVTCDIHPWMSAHVVVRDNPYWAVTDGSGRFAIPDVPAGRYKVSVWQESVGKGGAAAVEVEIRAGAETKQDFTVKPK